ncbi:MAG: PEP-CTERM sorting domain-containing protein [Azonexaceae bacterium]|nr:PEP-CTERM sorting domain-containing protein [Azonexaceae bacterium]
MANRLSAMSLAISSAALLLFASNVGAAAYPEFVLPTPENNANVTTALYPDATGALRPALMMAGIPIAFKYNDMWSYSARVLDQIQSSTSQLPSAIFGNYSFSTGTGTIPVLLTSESGTHTNLSGLQNPINVASNSSGNVLGWNGVWGASTQSFTSYLSGQGNYIDTTPGGGTSTIAEMLSALNALNPNATIPVFYADYNQSQGKTEASLFVSAVANIYDPTGTNILASFNLDGGTGSSYDPTKPTFNYGTATFYDVADTGQGNYAAAQAWCQLPANRYDPIAGTGCAGVLDPSSGMKTFSIDNNKGSGQPDFFAYAPEMDLGKYALDDLFVITLNIGCVPNLDPLTNGTSDAGCNVGGAEEFGIAGALAPRTNVPEPAVLSLLGLAMMALGFTRRRRSV